MWDLGQRSASGQRFRGTSPPDLAYGVRLHRGWTKDCSTLRLESVTPVAAVNSLVNTTHGGDVRALLHKMPCQATQSWVVGP